MRAYVICSKEEIESAKQKFQTLEEHLNFSFGHAVFPSNEEYKKYKDGKDNVSLCILGRKLLRGELGAALAHQGVYAAHATSGEPWALVLESDACLVGSKEAFDHTWKEIKLFMSRQRSDAPTILLLGYNSYSVLRRPRRGFSRVSVPPTGAYAYLINRAASLALETKNIDLPADWPQGILNANLFISSPVIFSHQEERPSLVDWTSEITRHLADDKTLSLASRFFQSRKLKIQNVWFRLALLRGFVIFLASRGRRNFH